jgi:hypothetical protein
MTSSTTGLPATTCQSAQKRLKMSQTELAARGEGEHPQVETFRIIN